MALPGAMLLSAAFAPVAFATNSVEKGLNNAKVSSNTTISTSGLFDDLNAGLVIVIGIAALWTIACIIFAAMKLSSSGGNPQKRNEGIVGLALAGLGGWAIYNSYDIYGWFSGIGKTGTIIVDVMKFL